MTRDIPGTLGCSLDTITTLTGQLATGLPLTSLQAADLIGATQDVLVTPALIRRNNLLLSADIGLDRQFEILSASEAPTSNWPKPYGLGARQSDQPAGGSRPPYSLGASSRPKARSAFDIWAEGSLSYFEDGGQLESDGRAGILYLGADYRLSPAVLVGALIQFDDAEQNLDHIGGRVRDDGWMVGPYTAVRLSEHIFLQARAAWGQSDNEVALADVYSDRFDTDRWLVRSTLIGQWRRQNWQFRPRASIGYIEEDQDAYVGQLGVVSASRTSLGQMKFGPEIGYQYQTAGGTLIEPRLMIEGIWNFAQSGGSLFVDDLVSGVDMRARAEVGLMLRAKDGLAAGASVHYDGLGSSDYHAIGGKVRVAVPIN